MISLQQIYKDKEIMREGENKKTDGKRNDKSATVGLKSSIFTSKLRSAILFYVFKAITLLFQVLKENLFVKL